MTRPVPADPVDERLRQLLDLEARLVNRVDQARVEADRRIAAEREGRARRLEAAVLEAERLDRERAEAERATYADDLAVLASAHQAALAVVTNVTDDAIDALARRALERAIDPEGERS